MSARRSGEAGPFGSDGELGVCQRGRRLRSYRQPCTAGCKKSNDIRKRLLVPPRIRNEVLAVGQYLFEAAPIKHVRYWDYYGACADDAVMQRDWLLTPAASAQKRRHSDRPRPPSLLE